MSNYYASNPYQQNPYGTSNENDPYAAANPTDHQQQAGQGQGQGQQSNTNFATSQQQWQQPQPNQNQNQHQNIQPQQQQAGGTTPFWNPAMASTFATVAATTAAGASGNPNAMFDLGLKAGHTFLDQGTARMIPGLERIMRELRLYFAVNNSYVKKKMLRVLFSFFHKNWVRINSAPGSIQKYELPIHDDNALDLYIPMMSLITYVLLCGLCYGTSGQFNPEVLPDVTTKCVLIQILEVLLFRLGFYMMQVPTGMIDLFSVTGYKYLGLTINMLVGYSLSLALVSGGHKGYYAMFLFTASSASYFMLKFMANNIPTVTASSGPKREFVVLAFAGSQFASMWFLGQTKFLN